MKNNWLSRALYIIFALVVLIILLLNVGLRYMRYNDSQILETFETSRIKVDVKIENHASVDVRLVVEKLNPGDSTLLVFVHGAPGSWDAWKNFMLDNDLSQNTRMIAYDRPGYGGSDLNPMQSIIDQSEVLLSIIDKYRLPRVIIVGHSYGGPIVSYAASLPNSNIDENILLAALVDPESEPIFWYSYFSHWTLTNWVFPSELKVAGVEKFSHAEELAKILSSWSKNTTPITFVHGLTDGLAPPIENIEFAKKHIPKSLLDLRVLENKGHLIIWDDFENIKAIVMEKIAK